MTDLIKSVYDSFHEEFEGGFFIFSDKHIRILLMHKKEKIQLRIIACLHFEGATKYNFSLEVKDTVVYERNVENERDFLILMDELFDRIGAEIGNECV